MEIANLEQLALVLQDHLHIDNLAQDDGELMFGFEFDHHGMKVSLMRTSDDKDARLMLFCDFGMLDSATEVRALRKLMEINLFLGHESNSAFGCSPDNGAVSFRCEHALPIQDIDQFVTMLDQIAGQATIWRRDYFLDEASEAEADFSMFQFA